jgi:hypothetical protein
MNYRDALITINNNYFNLRKSTSLLYCFLDLKILSISSFSIGDIAYLDKLLVFFCSLFTQKII